MKKRLPCIVLCLMICLMAFVSLAETVSGPMIRVTDTEGFPIEGVFVNICSDTMCIPVFTDETGEAHPELTETVYSVHILKVPEGYITDPEEEYILSDDMPVLTIMIEKAGDDV